MAPKESAIRQPSVAIETHGCKLNQADSSILAAEFVEAGYRLAADGEPADVYVVNTCTVTHVADRKARQALRSAARRNPKATVVATGCYAQRSPQDLKGLDGTDMVLGNRQKRELVSLVDSRLDRAPVPCATGFDAAPVEPTVMRARAAVKIQEGCDQVCAYCIVPKVRGRERSVPADRIMSQIDRLVARGYREVVLTGTQLGTYGFDLVEPDLQGLISRILDRTGLERLRVSSLQPQEVDHDLLNIWSDSRLCPHIHMPLQSGSDPVLRRMRRRYTAKDYSETVERVRRAVPGVSVTADVIAGFPGETNTEFEETVGLCEQLRFASLHVFPYSVRPGTSAAHFAEQVDPGTRARRVDRLLGLARDLGVEFRSELMGTVRPVLWESESATELSGPRSWTGLTDNYVRVVASSGRDLANQITPARLLKQEEDLVHAQVL